MFDVDPGVNRLQLRWNVEALLPWPRLLRADSDTPAFGVRLFSDSGLEAQVEPRTLASMVATTPALDGMGGQWLDRMLRRIDAVAYACIAHDCGVSRCCFLTRLSKPP